MPKYLIIYFGKSYFLFLLLWLGNIMFSNWDLGPDKQHHFFLSNGWETNHGLQVRLINNFRAKISVNTLRFVVSDEFWQHIGPFAKHHRKLASIHNLFMQNLVFFFWLDYSMQAGMKETPIEYWFLQKYQIGVSWGNDTGLYHQRHLKILLKGEWCDHSKLPQCSWLGTCRQNRNNEIVRIVPIKITSRILWFCYSWQNLCSSFLFVQQSCWQPVQST